MLAGQDSVNRQTMIAKANPTNDVWFFALREALILWQVLPQ
jgi:hypothetical protein